MILPEYVTVSLEALERAGFAAYCVGGCVRDGCLGLTPHDYDICTQALPEQTEAVFSGKKLSLTGKKHGTVAVVYEEDTVEITTFRAEGPYSDNRHPDWVRFVSDVAPDLARRDFTVNAMAWSPRRGFADPFGGQEDLKHKLLRTVGDPDVRFREDSLRILRGLRFAVRFGLTVEEGTWKAMLRQRHLLDNLSRERVFAELCTLLPLLSAEDMLRFGPILAAVIPELGPMIGFDQRSPHHAYDLYTHTAHVVAGVPRDLPLRWAALLHDIGKVPTFTQDATGRGHFYGHASVGAEMADVVLRRMRAPTPLREQVVLLIGGHMAKLAPEKKAVRRWLSHLDEDTALQLLTLQEADMRSKGVPCENKPERFPAIRSLIAELLAEKSCLQITDLAVKGQDLMALGFQGKAIGQIQKQLLEQVLEETLPNEREALLSWANGHKEIHP